MIVTCVYVNVIPEGIQQFIEETTKNHLESVKEPGNLRFDVLQQADEPGKFLIYEAFRSEEDVALHKTTPHYLAWRNAVEALMAEPRKGVKHKIIQPADKNKW